MKTNKYLIIIILFIIASTSCSKKISDPEKTDAIYIDLINELDITTKQEAQHTLQLSKDIEIFNKTTPQSGTATANRNKMSTTENLLAITKQQKKFFEIKIEKRKNYVLERYNESLEKNGRPWPDEKENADYKTRMKLQRDKFNWETNNVPRGTK